MSFPRRDFAIAGHSIRRRSSTCGVGIFIARKGRWTRPSDIKAVFSSASFLANNRVVFNIAGNRFRLVVKMVYECQRIYVRFVGTHQEYDRIDAANI